MDLYLLALAAADVTGGEILQWLNTSALVVIVALFLWGKIMPTSLVQSEMVGPLREENRELREMVKIAVATCERQAQINEGLTDQNAALASQLSELAGKVLDDKHRGGNRS